MFNHVRFAHLVVATLCLLCALVAADDYKDKEKEYKDEYKDDYKEKDYKEKEDKEHKYGATSHPEFDYLFTINYKFGGASPIIFSQGVTENINTFVGASIDGPALQGSINRGVITNKFVAFGKDTIVFEEATWYGSFNNGGKNGTFIAETSGLVDYGLNEHQRVKFVLDDGEYAYLQYIYILCGSIAFDLKTASAAQDCYQIRIGNKVVLPPIFT
nr:uncharacterized protein CI109_005327 [Kwoniella shandongensis]KAA5526370.1 hypothetical protein CI109_005327 [Kwoniella shandongensis]